MIQRLSIKNYAIIDELEIRFSPGLTIITGETGAGKSILLGALGLIMGRRADTKALYHDTEKCVVEGQFEVSRYDLPSFFEEHDLDYDPLVLVRRELLPSGKSRAFVNDTPVTLKVLQDLSNSLIDLHQQFDTLDIHESSFQLRMIDALAQHQESVAGYQEAYQDYQQDQKRLEERLRQQQEGAREHELLTFQFEELSKAALEPGEQETLEEELSRMSNAEDIKRTSGGAFQALREAELSIIDQLQELSMSLNPLKKHHSDLEQAANRLQSLILELEDLSGELENIAESTEYEPERLIEVQGRLDMMYKLQAKHQVNSLEELLEIQQKLEERLNNLGDLSTEIRHLQQSLEKKAEELTSKALELRKKRQGVAPDFAQKVIGLLQQLSMPYAQFEVSFEALDTPGPTGMDEVHFLFSANKGTDLQRIREVASGGEMSRLSLVTKSLVASAIPLPTLIFDEIDAGVSGDVAQKMGFILRLLSDEHQVICITHSPQVAAKADDHYFVYKKIKEERTVTHIRQLSREERIRAIAVMLSSNPPSESALENARELVQG